MGGENSFMTPQGQCQKIALLIFVQIYIAKKEKIFYF